MASGTKTETAKKKAYEAPRLTELGSLHGSTLQAGKHGPQCDVSCFHNTSVSHH